MIEILEITGVGHRGDGVAEGPDGPVFVPYALPGETVTAEPVPGHPDRRHLLRVDTESVERIAPICPHFGVCGGCAVQHWTEPRYRAWKRGLVLLALEQAGIDAPVAELVDAHGEGRRRIVLHARGGSGAVLQVGFAAPRAHRIVPIDRCPILVPGLERAIPAAWRLAEALRPLRKPLDIQATATDVGLDIDLRGSGALTQAMQTALAQLAVSLRLARLTRHGEMLAQAAPPTVRMGRATVPLPPGAFLQATAAGEQALAERVLAYTDGCKSVADLFCGVGPFTLRLAERARVQAFDNDAPAIAALLRAQANAPGLKPVKADARDLFRRPLLPQEFKSFDAVVLDPPRQGAESQARELAASTVPVVVMVSCNPATFARDARILMGGGYRLAEVTPVDQFRYSAHVELVAAFRR
ncbi:MAG TPA: class I SAM-dependent RNA methyltransferase [Xanthobacteraceae bacterium]